MPRRHTDRRATVTSPAAAGCTWSGRAAAVPVAVAVLGVLLSLVLAGPSTASTPAAAPPAGASPSVVPPSPAAWTVMVYMDGDNDLEPWVTHDLDGELAAIGSNADVQVVALADRGRHPSPADGGWRGARIFHVTRGMKATAENAAADWGEADMGSPQTLIDFVRWTRAEYPARRYALILWDHGWGWWPGNTMQDVTSNDYLDMDELRRALQTVGGVDMAGMETCLGQTIEVQAEFRGVARALAGSEDSTGYTTFFYPEILGALQERPAMTASELAVVAARSIRAEHDKWSLTGSAVALDWRWDRLAQAVSDLGWCLGSDIERYRAALGAARRGTASLPQAYAEVRDLYDMAAQIKAHVTSPEVRTQCDLVMKWSRRCTLYEWSPRSVGRMHGTAIFWPAGPRRSAVFSQWTNFVYYASQLTFTRLTYWAEFLDAWGG